MKSRTVVLNIVLKHTFSDIWRSNRRLLIMSLCIVWCVWVCVCEYMCVSMLISIIFINCGYVYHNRFGTPVLCFRGKAKRGNWADPVIKRIYLRTSLFGSGKSGNLKCFKKGSKISAWQVQSVKHGGGAGNINNKRLLMWQNLFQTSNSIILKSN